MSNDRVMPGFIARGSQAQHRRIDLIRVTAEGSAARTDDVSVEEPLDIVITTEGSVTHVQDTSSITMRTPGNDDELILGFLYSEGIVSNLNDVVSIEHSAPANSETGLHNAARVTLASEITFKRQEIERQFTRSSSCGVCGRTSLETLLALKPIDTSDSVRVTAEFMQRLPDEVSRQQREFGRTGGIHAAALFDRKGQCKLLREDVGRHNALDKLLGASLKSDALPLEGDTLFLSGRSSFELLQKAAMAGIEVVASVGAPSSLAVEVADACQITLAGFLKQDSFNIYTHPHRISTR